MSADDFREEPSRQPMRVAIAGPIHVINPNSNQAVTDGLAEALACFRAPGWPVVECVTLTEGPFGIESQRDCDAVVMPLVKLVEARTDAAAHVIACYSDPGLDACRSVSEAPVFGIQEAGVLAALARGDRFGVVAKDRRFGDRPAGIQPRVRVAGDDMGGGIRPRLHQLHQR
ncbi:MAG: aspartate/glutamate racemase family protein, partial [Pseudomonadota bacterium]